jgi:molybdopterin-containing oxidoreductase family membrane subunit
MSLKQMIQVKDDISFKFTPTAFNSILAVLTIGLLAMYVYGVINFLNHGHHAFGVSREHPWGFLVAAYEFFVAVSMGSIAIASAGLFFNIEIIKPLIKRLLVFGLLSLISGFSVFLLEIGHPITMIIYTALSGNPTSALFWLGVFYPLTMLFTFLTFIAYTNEKNTKLLSLLALIFANSSILTAGSIFGNINNSPIASGVFFQIEFIASGLLGGIFLFAIIGSLINKDTKFEQGVVFLKKSSIVLLSLLLIMYLVKYITGAYGSMPGKIEAVEYIMNAPRFWLYEVGFGLVVPFLVAVFGSKEKIGLFGLASIFGLVGLMAARINVIDMLEIAPKQLLNTHVYQEHVKIITYTPTITELSIGLGAIGILIFLLFMAEKILKLDD